MEFTKKEVKDALDDMVKNGHLKKVGNAYQDSDEVTSLLKKGKSREEIDKILKKRK